MELTKERKKEIKDAYKASQKAEHEQHAAEAQRNGRYKDGYSRF